MRRPSLTQGRDLRDLTSEMKVCFYSCVVEGRNLK